MLSAVTSTVSRQACEEDKSRQASEEDESRQASEEDDEEGDSDNECETCGYISSDECNDGDGTPTSEYDSAKDEIMSRSHYSDTGENGATVPYKKECDIKDNGGGRKREVDEALQKCDVNATVPADQKERDVTEHEKRGVDEHVQNHDVNATVEFYVIEND